MRQDKRIIVTACAAESAVVTSLRPRLHDGHIVEALDGVLWSFGYSDIARFDGTQWKRYPTDKP